MHSSACSDRKPVTHYHAVIIRKIRTSVDLKPDMVARGEILRKLFLSYSLSYCLCIKLQCVTQVRKIRFGYIFYVSTHFA